MNHLEAALAKHRDLEDGRNEALDWLMLGIVCVECCPARAQISFQQALEKARQINDALIYRKAAQHLKQGAGASNGGPGQKTDGRLTAGLSATTYCTSIPRTIGSLWSPNIS